MEHPIHRFKADFFKALGHPTRLAILDFLRDGEKSVNELQALLKVDQSTVSQQLSKLRNANIVDPRKVGTSVYYSICNPMIFSLLDVAREIFSEQLVGTQDMLQELRQETPMST
jgi:ArsR family transcriptional regulator